MNKLALPIFLILFTLFCPRIEAQRTCGMDAHMDALLQDPEYAKEYHERQLNFKAIHSETTRSANCEEVFILPMAVHYQGFSNPDMDCLISLAEIQIQILNDDYQGINADITNWENIAAANFPGISNGEACIEFCLATQGHPDGSGLNEGDPAVTFNATTGDDAPAWSGYINIFVRNIGGGILGYSPLGGTGLGDGVTIDNDYFGSGSGCAGATPTAPFNLGRTLTHELGHYLYLEHIWGNGCSVDDGVADTPNSASEYYNCPNVGVSSCGSVDMHMNYMDYVNDACMYAFTAGQATVMENYAAANLQHVLNNASAVCARDTTDIGVFELVSPVSSADLGAAETVEIRVSNFGLDTIQNFTVGYSLNGTDMEDVDVDSMLVPDAIYNHTFTVPANMDALGEYTFTLKTDMVGDQNPQNNTLTRVVTKYTRYDAAISDVIAPQLSCSDEVELEVVITNMGEMPLTSATISYALNGGDPVTMNWTGNLAMEQSDEVIVVVAGLLDGTNTIIFGVDDPNGEMDEDSSNDTFSRDFDVNPEGEALMFSLLTDNYPEETSWDLRDENGMILYAGGPYNEAQTTFSEIWCLAPFACYEFRIYDSYGDGIQFGGVEGNYEITNEDGETLASLQEVNFGSEEMAAFCIVDCNLNASIETTPDLDAGMNGSITIYTLGGFSPLEYSLNGGVPQSDNVFEGLSAGAYSVVVTDVFGCSVTLEGEVESILTNTNDIFAAAVSIQPNPTNDVFSLEIQGVNAVNELEIEVFDATGKLIVETLATRSGNVFSKQISLGNFPEGLYFVHLKNEAAHQVHKVVRF